MVLAFSRQSYIFFGATTSAQCVFGAKLRSTCALVTYIKLTHNNQIFRNDFVFNYNRLCKTFSSNNWMQNIYPLRFRIVLFPYQYIFFDGTIKNIGTGSYFISWWIYQFTFSLFPVCLLPPRNNHNFNACKSRAQVLGTTHVHEFHISFSHPEWFAIDEIIFPNVKDSNVNNLTIIIIRCNCVYCLYFSIRICYCFR